MTLEIHEDIIDTDEANKLGLSNAESIEGKHWDLAEVAEGLSYNGARQSSVYNNNHKEGKIGHIENNH